MKCRIEIKMFRVILLTSVLTVVLASESSDEACKSLMSSPGINCAKDTFIRTTIFGHGTHTDDLNECYPLRQKSKSCEFNLCVAKTKGYLSADGTVDKKTFTEMMEKEFESNPQLLDKIKNKCINGDLSKYEKIDGTLCEILKIQFCVDTQVCKTIDVWDDEGKCKGVKTLMEECINQFD